MTVKVVLSVTVTEVQRDTGKMAAAYGELDDCQSCTVSHCHCHRGPEILERWQQHKASWMTVKVVLSVTVTVTEVQRDTGKMAAVHCMLDDP